MSELAKTSFRFDIAFSFAGAHREKVLRIAQLVQEKLGAGKVFYDDWFEHEIVGPDLDPLLRRIFLEQSLMVVADLSEEYAGRPWCQVEARAIRELRFETDSARDETKRLRLVSIRLGPGDVPGVARTEAYLDGVSKTVEECAALLLERLRLLRERLGGTLEPPKPPAGMQRPEPKKNNLWFKAGSSDQAIVFVHGVLSDSRDCWYAEPSGSRPGVYWPSLVEQDPRFSEYSIFLGGYNTEAGSGPWRVENCAEELFLALRRPGRNGAVLSQRTLVFVCHGVGGIVVQYMLSVRPWEFREKKLGLGLIATPLFGTVMENRLDLLLRYFKNEQGIKLQWGNWSLKDVDYRFQVLLKDRAIPGLTGQEAYESRFVSNAEWLSEAESMVPEGLAGRYFGPARILHQTTHFTCVQPQERDHPAYGFLEDLCLEVEQLGSRPETVVTPPASADTTASAQNGAGRCSGLHWDLVIDEEGDAYNEMSYEGIVLAEDAPLVLPLPPAEVQSGHFSPFDLKRDGRTSEGVRLDQHLYDTPLPRLETNVVFENRPTPAHPANCCLSSYDWNVYAMNMEEYRQKPSWREDGLDYVEKSIREAWAFFTLLVRFPEQLVFAKEPFFEVYERSGDEEQRADRLSAELRECFYFSRAQRTALLSIRRPPAPYFYRVAWLVGESRAAVTSPLVPKQRYRQQQFAKSLLSMREILFDKPAAGGSGNSAAAITRRDIAARQLYDTVNSVLASVAQYLEEELQVRPLDAEELDLSLMVLDEQPSRKHPVLRVVAGTHLAISPFRKLELAVGDGNAGRAWKRRMARVFDCNDKDAKRHIYISLEDTPPHQFLVSVPLIDPDSAALVYGILNIGTFSSAEAQVLRMLGGADQIQKLTGYAQAFVLKRLLESMEGVKL